MRTSGPFSLLTSAYDTAPKYLHALARSVFSQTVRDFEWVLLDNGSSHPETLRALAEIGRDRRVRSVRLETNRGIVGGMRACLEAAKGRYVVPLDSDDLLEPDTLQVLGAVLDERGHPPLAFSDEDKVADDGERFQAYFKPGWDPVLFWNSCYIAHVCAIDRSLALEYGAYDDSGADGCHDWDTFFRFLARGHTPVHVPEVLYTWRLHPQSCAGNIDSKSYIHRSHRHVLGRNLASSGDGERFSLEPSPLFDGTPDWWIRRRHVDPPPIALLRIDDGTSGLAAPCESLPGLVEVIDCSPEPESFLGGVEACRRASGDGGLIVLQHAGVMPNGDEWGWDAIGLFERFPDTGVVGGRILSPQGFVWCAGQYFGFDGLVGSPDRGRERPDPGYFAHCLKQRSVSAVSGMLCMVRPDLLGRFAARRERWSPVLLGAWLGAEACDLGLRVVYTPFLEARIEREELQPTRAPRDEARAFFERWGRFVPDQRFYSPHMSLASFEPYAPAFPATRAADLAQALRRWGIETA